MDDYFTFTDENFHSYQIFLSLRVFYTNRPRGILFPDEINYAYVLLPVRRGAAPDLLVIVHEHCLFQQEIVFRVVNLFCSHVTGTLWRVVTNVGSVCVRPSEVTNTTSQHVRHTGMVHGEINSPVLEYKYF